MHVKNDDDLHGGQRSSENKCDKVCTMATIMVKIVADASQE